MNQNPYSCPVCNLGSMDHLGGDRWRCPRCQQDHTPPSLDETQIAALRERIAEADRAWGGYRKGAGRIAKRGPTKPVRIPVAYESAVQALIEHLDNTAMINHHYRAAESEPMFMRSLLGQRQFISFKTSPNRPDEEGCTPGESD